VTPTAEELYARGRALSDQRRYVEAGAVLADAAAIATDPDLSARIVGTRAYALTQTGAADEGERACREALADARLSPHTRGVLAGQLGSVLVHQGRLDEGLQWLGLAIDTIPDDPLAVANLRVNRSVLHMQRRDIAASRDDLQAALEVFEERGSDIDVAEARHNLGYAALIAGDLVQAMRDMALARPTLAAQSAVNAAISDSDRAEVLRDAGLVTDAERLLDAAAAAFGRDGMPQARAQAELHLAASLLRHDPARAEATARAAARRFTSLGAESWAARAEGIRLRARLAGGLMVRSARFVSGSRARVRDADVDRVARALTRAGFENEAAALRLSRELWRARTGRPAGRMPRLTPSTSLDVRLLAHEVRALRALAAGRHGHARRLAADGLAELTAWRSAYGSLDLQTSLAMHGLGLLLAGIDAAVQSQDPAHVFEWSERARQLSQQVVPLRPPPDPALAADLTELRMLRADLSDADWLTDPRVVALGDRVRHRQWTATGAADLETRLDLTGIHDRLDVDTAVLSYVFGTSGLICVVVSADGATLVELTEWDAARSALAGLRADLDMAASVRTGPMVAVVRASLDRRLAELSRVLVEGPLRHAGGRRLVITAPGILSGLPWSMLPALGGRPFTLAPSASRWARSAVASPRSVGFAAGPRVARGAEEITAAAAAWPGARTLQGAEATVSSVSELASGVDLLHIAAHGRHSVDNPLFSGLELADGILFGHDIDHIATVPRIVILSACEVGRSSVRWGEEAVGMTRAWLHAGSGCVIAAPVVVADDDACELLGAVHAELAAGTAPAEALAAAQRSTGIVAPFQCHGAGF
jgi:tetratricopeptide (TPR) repeat protein